MKQYYLVYNATTSTIDCWCGDNSKADFLLTLGKSILPLGNKKSRIVSRETIKTFLKGATMIQSKLGEVKITRPNYELCEILHCSKSDVDNVVEASLGADLTSILGALGDIYGTEHAMEMWTRSAEVYIETMKGETT